MITALERVIMALVLLYQQLFVHAQTNMIAVLRLHVICIDQSNFKFCVIEL